MTTSQESVFVELKLSGKLPSPSSVGMEILRVTRGDDHSTDEIGRTIEADPALTGRILKIANSAENASVKPVTTVSEATMRLGISTVRNVALGFTLVGGNRQGACAAFDYDAYWSESVLRAVASQRLVERVGGCQPAEGFICGLLAEVGRLAMASVHPERYSDLIVEKQYALPKEFADAERAVFHIRHGEVAAEMMEEWGLPEVFRESVAGLDEFEVGQVDLAEPVQALQFSLFVATAIARSAMTSEAAPATLWRDRVETLERVRAALELDEAAFAELYTGIDRSWKEWSASLGVSTPSTVTLEDMQRFAQRADGPSGPAELRTRVVQRDIDELRLFVVDDDPQARAEAVAMLGGTSWTVRSCSSADDPLRQVLEWSAHVVMVSESSGCTELCTSLRRCDDGQRTHIMIMSRAGNPEALAAAFNNGVDEHIDLPLHADMLAARLRSTERIIRLQLNLDAEQETVRRQVAELGVLTRRLRAASLTDPLTELPNRRFMMKRLEQDWSVCERSNAPLSVISIDIDHFKSVNDSYGHDVGDVVLREVARVLRKAARKGEQPARVGGEEFLIALRDSDLNGARLAAERIRAAVYAQHIEAGDFSRNVTISLGVASKVPGIDSLDALLRAADEALYAAKHSGRNRVHVFGDEAEGARKVG